MAKTNSGPAASQNAQQHRSQGVMERMCLAAMSNSSAACVTNPLDVAKVRLQLDGIASGASGSHRQYNGFVDCMSKIVKQEGFRGLYKGLVASIMREVGYSGIRLGAYEHVKEALGGTDKRNTPLHIKVAAGALTGSVGAFVTTPIDLVKVRIQADIKGTAYPSTRGAFVDVFRKEGGWAGLFQGWSPNTVRAGILTASQVPSYDHIKHSILNAGTMEEGILLHLVCSFCAGFITAVTTSPVDVVKSRLMNQGATNRMYSGVADCVLSIVKHEGAGGLFKGFVPNWIRIAPHTTVSLLVFETLRRAVGGAPM